MNADKSRAALAEQLDKLEERIGALAPYLRSALNYVTSDPKSSLTKCRIVLEKILTSMYVHEMGKEPDKGMIGNILSDKVFSSKIPARIRARMNFIRELANLGPHAGNVEGEDAMQVLNEAVYLTDWYLSKYDGPNAIQYDDAQEIEILPRLNAQYSGWLRPDLTSVKFRQTERRCYIEIATVKIVGGDLEDEIIKRTDLSFVFGGSDEGLYFKPSENININAEKFVTEFDEVSIINCTDLFTEEAGTKIYEYWKEHGRTPSGK